MDTKIISGICKCCKKSYVFCPTCHSYIYGKENGEKVIFSCECGWSMEKDIDTTLSQNSVK